LAGYDTEVDPCEKGMYIMIVRDNHIPEGEQVELNIDSATVHVKREQHWPSNAAADKSYDTEDLHISKEKKAIE
jgi:hypothetical protein